LGCAKVNVFPAAARTRFIAASLVVTAGAEPAPGTVSGDAAGTDAGADAEATTGAPARDPASPGAVPTVCRCDAAAEVGCDAAAAASVAAWTVPSKKT
jgi:hypothetical protein